MALALQQLINGLTLGAVYGLIAIGYTMVYGIIGMINFAHGDIYMVSAFIAVTVFTLLATFGISSIPLSLLLVLLVAVLFTSVYGWTVERIAYRPLRGSTPAGAADLGDRHVDLPAEHGATDAGRARQADRAGAGRRHRPADRSTASRFAWRTRRSSSSSSPSP
jgi:hypothetical protein